MHTRYVTGHLRQLLVAGLMICAISTVAFGEATEAEPRLRVAVLDFASSTGRSFMSCEVRVTPIGDAGSRLSGEISERLGSWHDYSVIEPDQVRNAVKRHKLEKRGLSTPSSLRKLAEVLGADAVVLGQTEGNVWSGKGRVGGSLYASLQMISTSDFQVIWSIDGNTTDLQAPENLVANLADSMTKDLFVRLVEGNARPLLAMHRIEP